MLSPARDLGFIFAEYFTALWHKSDHLHTRPLLIKEQPAESD